MIFTITLNPSVDYYMRVYDAQFSDVNRVSEVEFVAAGKGINVSKILDVMSIPSTAVYFSGGVTGDFIDEQLSKMTNIVSRPIRIDDLTRVNVKICGGVDNAFNPIGPTISEEAKGEMLAAFEQVSQDDVVIISGSLPRGVDRGYVKTLCRQISGHGAKVVLDVSNFTLEDYQGLDLYLIKPNRDELLDILQLKETSEINYREACSKLHEAGVENVLLSLGSEGSFYDGSYGSYRISTPKVKVVKSIGAGDSMLGAFVGTMMTTNDIEESLRMASAAGTALVSCDGMPSMETINEIKGIIHLATI